MTKVTNELLIDEIIRSKEIGQTTGQLSWSMFRLIREMVNRPRWITLPYREELLRRAAKDLTRCWVNFKPELSDKPRSYFIQVIKSSFIRIWWERTREAREAGQAWERGRQVL